MFIIRREWKKNEEVGEIRKGTYKLVVWTNLRIFEGYEGGSIKDISATKISG